MKQLFLFLFLLVSFSAKPGEKGNGVEDVTSLEGTEAVQKVLEAAIEAKEVTLKNLAIKKLNRNIDGKLELVAGPTLTPPSIEIKRYMALLRIFITNTEQELLEDITIANAEFYQAFGLLNAATILQSSNLTKAEKQEVLANLETEYSNFWKEARNEVLKTASPEAWKAFVLMIDSSKLGYKIQ